MAESDQIFSKAKAATSKNARVTNRGGETGNKTCKNFMTTSKGKRRQKGKEIFNRVHMGPTLREVQFK